MPKEEWGVKRVCPKCATRFYDLQNDPMTCPSCEAVFDAASLTLQKTRVAAAEKPVKVEEPAAADEDLEEAVVLDESDDNSDENIGDDLLDDDDDDDTVTLDEIADVSNEDNES